VARNGARTRPSAARSPKSRPASPRRKTATGHREEQIVTPVTVHALLLLYDKDDGSAEAWAAAGGGGAEALHDVKIVHRLPLELRSMRRASRREHFGFADGISQPVRSIRMRWCSAPARPAVRKINGTACRSARSCSAIPTAITRRRQGRCVPDDKDGNGLAAGLTPHPLAEGLSRSRARRQLHGRARAEAGCRRLLAIDARQAPRISASAIPIFGHVTTTWLAERVVGRNTKGDLLCPAGYLPPDQYDQPRMISASSTATCTASVAPPDRMSAAPIRATAWRPTPDQKQTLLDAANNHRILRRGRKYGCDDQRAAQGGRGRSRAAVHLPQHRHRPPVRVRSADLAAQPELRDPL
jgi:hypothetical protein